MPAFHLNQRQSSLMYSFSSSLCQAIWIKFNLRLDCIYINGESSYQWGNFPMSESKQIKNQDMFSTYPDFLFTLISLAILIYNKSSLSNMRLRENAMRWDDLIPVTNARRFAHRRLHPKLLLLRSFGTTLHRFRLNTRM